jgi:hypothetical protein
VAQKEFDKNPKDPDQHIVLYSEETEEYFMFYESHQGKSIKKKAVITNAFTTIKASKGYPGLNTIKIAYRQYFNANDRFNHFLNSRYWPYKRTSWQSNYDDFFLGVLQMNTYSYWHEYKKITNENNFIPWHDFTLQLSTSLFQSLT